MYLIKRVEDVNVSAIIQWNTSDVLVVIIEVVCDDKSVSNKILEGSYRKYSDIQYVYMYVECILYACKLYVCIYTYYAANTMYHAYVQIQFWNQYLAMICGYPDYRSFFFLQLWTQIIASYEIFSR